MLSFYNTLTKKQEDFHPIHDGHVGMYSCGPTVYWFAHIGNLRAFLFVDVLRRVFELNEFKVKHIMNITDVGHLTDDSDEGDDKMIVAMKREGKTAFEIAEFYTQAFFQDLDRLNILRVDEYPKATEHINDQIELIQTLEQKGFTYKTSDGIYFDTSQFSEYGRLSGQKSEDKQAGVRVEMGEKKHTTDFALWKFSAVDESRPSTSSGHLPKRQMEWPSPWGVGFPGWHIECSAMSKKYLGIPFDIHTGGIDHIAVHHENEIAQTFGTEGKLEANYWLHNEFVTLDGRKMSKSLGNILTIRDLIDKGFDPISFRYLCLQAHYRSKLNFTLDALAAAQNALQRLRSTVLEWNCDVEEGGFTFEQKFMESIDDDLNTPQALAVLWNVIGSEESVGVKKYLVNKMDRVFGLGLMDQIGTTMEIPKEIQKMINAREVARTEKNWSMSDQLREELLANGYLVEDTSDGQKVKKV